MAEIVHRLSELSHLRISWFGCSDDDSANRLNHRHTVLMLLIFSAILTSRLFISDLIICWTPGEFTGKYYHILFMIQLNKQKQFNQIKSPVVFINWKINQIEAIKIHV
ncbi:unnamed protein product [Rotaria socialis]|uniref:Uncharacterized protein n=1 Tax=Rotaria socialis TaxID=392032 RepID=A0A818EC51_9BILA|nr:unnamed protein product [Rotaria socialis]CAF4686110.1 unnamed protein product [Rotaria socialis]